MPWKDWSAERLGVALSNLALREAPRTEIQVVDGAGGEDPSPRGIVDDDEVAGDLHEEACDLLVEHRPDERVGDDDLRRAGGVEVDLAGRAVDRR